MSVKSLTSSSEVDDAIKDGVVVIWVYDSDGANRGFGKQYESYVVGENPSATFCKAGSDDVKDAMKKHNMDVDWVTVFKNGERVGDHREDHNAVNLEVQKHR